MLLVLLHMKPNQSGDSVTRVLLKNKTFVKFSAAQHHPRNLDKVSKSVAMLGSVV